MMKASLSPFKKIKFVIITWSLCFLSACTFEATMKKSDSSGETSPSNPSTPSVIISSAVNASTPALVPISGSCPNGSDRVTVQVNSNFFSEILCSENQYNGNLDLSTTTDGSIYIVVSTTSASSDEILVTKDTVPPTAPTGASVTSVYNSLTESPSLTWTASTDVGSGIARYLARVVKSSDSSLVADWQELGSNNILTGLNLTDGTGYKFEIQAIDNVGNPSTTAQSNSWTVDATSPDVSSIAFNDGTNTWDTSKTPLFT